MGTEDDLLPFQLHAAYVMFWALTCFAMRWEHLGSMFGGPAKAASSEMKEVQGSTPGEVVGAVEASENSAKNEV